ncbi:MAG: SRPBCC family protein [Fibrobacteria bacterium]
MIQPSKTLSLSIDAPFKEAYDYISDVANLPKWAPGFFLSVERVNGKWIASTTIGHVGIRFADRNPFGILDHYVTVEAGPETANPMRLIPNGTGCELLFTLFRTPEMSEEQFADDAETVLKDLVKLQAVLQSSGK